MCKPNKLKAIELLKKQLPDAPEEELRAVVDLQYSLAEILLEKWKQKHNETKYD